MDTPRLRMLLDAQLQVGCAHNSLTSPNTLLVGVAIGKCFLPSSILELDSEQFSRSLSYKMQMYVLDMQMLVPRHPKAGRLDYWGKKGEEAIETPGSD